MATPEKNQQTRLGTLANRPPTTPTQHVRHQTPRAPRRMDPTPVITVPMVRTPQQTVNPPRRTNHHLPTLQETQTPQQPQHQPTVPHTKQILHAPVATPPQHSTISRRLHQQRRENLHSPRNRSPVQTTAGTHPSLNQHSRLLHTDAPTLPPTARTTTIRTRTITNVQSRTPHSRTTHRSHSIMLHQPTTLANTHILVNT
jgi:hypothetical protein